MGLTTAMYTGLTGLSVNQTRIDTIGNNIANVNTHSFKETRTLFQTQFSRLASMGNGPSDTSGGVNPMQFGLGAVVGANQRNFNPGSIENTGIPSDLAIEGDGFFIVRDAEGRQLYTRDGAFSVDSDNRLVTVDGNVVRGFGVDEQFNIIPTVLEDITIPLGTLSVARATETVEMDGDLSAEGTIATQGSVHRTQQFLTEAGAVADADTLLTDLRNAGDLATPLFVDGDTITISGMTKGDRTLPSATFTIGTDGSTLGDFAEWMSTYAGVQDVDGVPGDPGIVIEDGALVFRSNAGEANGFEITGNDFVSSNAAVSLPFSITAEQAANGSGLFTSFTVYDSLGTPVVVTASFALEETAATGPIWRFYLETTDESGLAQSLGTGLVRFDTNGNYLSAEGNQVSLDRSGTGAASPMQFTLDFSQVHGLSTQVS
ncbi:MAG: flagellar hook-basal body complex protein, partial [Planctomycetota bacterium]